MRHVAVTRREVVEAFNEVERLERLKARGQDVDWELFLAENWRDQILGLGDPYPDRYDWSWPF